MKRCDDGLSFRVEDTSSAVASFPPLTLRLWIPGVFPGMNEITKAAKSGRGRGNGYSRMKASNDARVVYAVKGVPFPKFGRARFQFIWHEPSKRRDPDNVIAGQKFVFDGLVKGGVLPGDGWTVVAGISHDFAVSPDRPGVEVSIVEVAQ